MQFIALLIPALGSILLVILAWMQANSRLSDLRTDTHRQFDGVNRQLEGLNRRIDSAEGALDQKISALAGQVTTLASDYRSFYGLEQKLEGRVDELSKRIA